MDVGVLLPVSIQTRFKGDELWIRVAPDEPWFVRDDPRPTAEEIDALRRYAEGAPEQSATDPPPAWLRLATEVGPARAAYLHRTFVSMGAGGLIVAEPAAGELRSEPALPRIVDFPTELRVWAFDGSALSELLRLTVDVSRLLADFADPDVAGDRRWWESWDEAVEVGVAGIVPRSTLPARMDALVVTGLGTADPATLFAALAAEGRLGLLHPGQPTNSVDGAAAASLATDAATWWHHRSTPSAPGPAHADMSVALTGQPAVLGSVPGSDTPHREPATALVDALWPALGGFAATYLNDVAAEPIGDWARAALYPEGAYPLLRVGPQPYGVLVTTSWRRWQAAAGDPDVERGVIDVVRQIQGRYVTAARARLTAVEADTAGVLDLLADTPSSSSYRLRRVFPLQLWWLGAGIAGQPEPYVEYLGRWRAAHPLHAELGVTPARRYVARATSTPLGLPLVVPAGATAADMPALLTALVTAAREHPESFADTAALETNVLSGRGASLLIRLVIRSLQLVTADAARTDAGEPPRPGSLDLDAILASGAVASRFETRLRRARRIGPIPPAVLRRRRDDDEFPDPIEPDPIEPDPIEPDPIEPTPTPRPDRATALRNLERVLDAVTVLATVAAADIADLERRMRATLDCATHRIDPWLVGAPQRRLDAIQDAGRVRRTLGAYGWVDAPRPGHPGPNAAGVTYTPSAGSATVAAVLRDRAVSDPSRRWDLAITSRLARRADRIAAAVRAGEHLAEVVGRLIEHIVGDPSGVGALRRSFPVRSEHAGRRVCDGMAVLAAASLPVTLSEAQLTDVQELRDVLDTYGDLLVADAVHHLTGGRAELAGAAMDAAAGVARPPELDLLRTVRNGRAVSSSVVVAIPFVTPPVLPTGAALASQSPATVLDPSVAELVATKHPPATWDLAVEAATGAVAVSLADLALAPIDALALDPPAIERLAREHAGVTADTAVGGRFRQTYAAAAALIAVIGTRPATPRSVSEDRAVVLMDEASPADLVARYESVRQVGQALADELARAVDAPEPAALAELLRACRRWGIVPAEGTDAETGARQALDNVRTRLAAAPAAAGLGRAALSTAARALVASTGQVAVTAAVSAVPSVHRAAGFDDEWLSVTAAVRTDLARLDAYQLAAADPFVPYVNRADDPWQADADDARALVAVYATPGLDPTAPGSTIAASVVDRLDEVIPDAAQIAGAAFGFDAPAARAQQAVLIAVPPVADQALDADLLAQIVVETRDLAHARMARPVDVGQSLNAVLGAATVPATGAAAINLETTA
jgi:hypothetical protein